MTLKGKTLEGFITFWLAILAILILSLQSTLLWYLNLSIWKIALSTTISTVMLLGMINHIRNKIICGFNRAMLHLEAVKLEDYKQYAKPVFPRGVVGKFHQQLRSFSEYLSIKKRHYDQHVFLVYQLIDQLDTPILVFNQKNQLSYANGAFSHLFGQPWQMFRYASPKLLGLIENGDDWHLDHNEHPKKQQWQISQSTFIDDGVAHQLLVFTNIESALRSEQVKAWQQIINVMGHEIRNSLTPVSSIAETLLARAENDRDREALALISERCFHLQDFISRYASISRKINLNYQIISIPELVNRLKGLFSDIELNVKVEADSIWADKIVLEQVMINLLKNSKEAFAKNIELRFFRQGQNSIIEVVDNGHGFANLENLFVPLFSTKQEGQGIGLTFCRNIIEQHNGSINLVNNQGRGVTIKMVLPIPDDKSSEISPISNC